MKGNKFEKKVEEASTKKLYKMYLNRLDKTPSDRKVEELRLLSGKIPDNVKDDLQYAYYEIATRKANEERFRVLTGYGQCRGNLVVHNNDIIVCCCRELATVVAFHNAFYSRGNLHIPGENGSASRCNDSVYVIPDDDLISFSYCPFCQAHIQEKIDFFKSGEEEKEE